MKKNSKKVFYTPHGAFLYGLPGSSFDSVYVVTESNSQQIKYYVDKDNVDVTEVGLLKFLSLCAEGNAQALEALFSQMKVWVNPAYRTLVDNVVFSNEFTLVRLEKVVQRLLESGNSEKLFHAFRVKFQADSLASSGGFNPTLSPEEIVQILQAVSSFSELD